MRVAVYSGSFDPLHIGHLAILRELSSSGLYDSILLIISPQNPLKESGKAHSAKERYDSALCALNRHPELSKVRVSDIELTMPPPHYSIRTLDKLREMHPEDRFTLIIGADNLGCIRRWKDYPRILREYGVNVFPREGYDIDTLKKELILEDSSFIIDFFDTPLVTISSTFIREMKAMGEDVSSYLM